MFRVTRIRRTEYFDVWAGEMPSAAECCARRAHLRAMGWRIVDVSESWPAFESCGARTPLKTNIGIYLNHVFDFIELGDVLWVGDLLTVCQTQKCA
ncbi:hypothetical protein FGE12_28570 [Aggregicoccus sp. 17bor-14]|uniref:hypothetical protein n=1 Tax=Myxococcaceae TaxID=31 RepID=UPI00129C7F5B|nr:MULTISPECIES: hypothetical protein [Myxococcaceae]MBF5046402.1 hypothetical protein [Simulacricoccus sp. 17bor-14]MRI92122.1 hypothetical protein [Aggregicoccus sp. 17bor-14]